MLFVLQTFFKITYYNEIWALFIILEIQVAHEGNSAHIKSKKHMTYNLIHTHSTIIRLFNH